MEVVHLLLGRGTGWQKSNPDSGVRRMLVLSRKEGEEVVIDGGITLKITEIRGGKVRIGITAPSSTGIRRAELDAVSGNAGPGVVGDSNGEEIAHSSMRPGGGGLGRFRRAA